MDDFIDQFYKPLFDMTPMDKANFMFKLIDFDNDGIIHASDLVEAQQYIEELSDFGQEMAKLSEHYIQSYLKMKGKLSYTD